MGFMTRRSSTETWALCLALLLAPGTAGASYAGSPAEKAADPAPPEVRAWLEKRAATIAGDRQGPFVAEALAAIAEAGGLAVGPAYIEAARRRIAYRESLT